MSEKTTATARELARLFTARSAASKGGERHVEPKQVTAWFYKRINNGFPDEIGWEKGERGPRRRVWDRAAALEWFLSYVPSKGGAPLGNRNAFRHGRCVGVRADREATSAERWAENPSRTR